MAALGKQGGSIPANVQAPRVDGTAPSGSGSAPDGCVCEPIYTPPTPAGKGKIR